MNDNRNLGIFGIIGAFIGLGGAAYGFDQSNKRANEQSRFNSCLQETRAKLAEKEAGLVQLTARLGEKNVECCWNARYF